MNHGGKGNTMNQELWWLIGALIGIAALIFILKYLKSDGGGDYDNSHDGGSHGGGDAGGD
jgi:hypothetical protein